MVNEDCFLSINEANNRSKEFCYNGYGIDPKLNFDYTINKFSNKPDISLIGDHLMFFMTDFEGDVIYFLDDQVPFIRKNSKIYVYKKMGFWGGLFQQFNMSYELIDKELYKIDWQSMQQV